MNSKQSSGALKGFGVVLLLFGLVYAVVGTLAMVGTMKGVLPGHETQEILVVVLAYAVAVLNVLTGIVCLAGARTAARVLGVIVAIVGAAGVIYNQIVLDSFNYFDFVSLLLGISIVAAAKNKK